MRLKSFQNASSFETSHMQSKLHNVNSFIQKNGWRVIAEDQIEKATAIKAVAQLRVFLQNVQYEVHQGVIKLFLHLYQYELTPSTPLSTNNAPNK